MNTSREFGKIVIVSDPGIPVLIVDDRRVPIQQVLERFGVLDEFQKLANDCTLVKLLSREGETYVIAKSNYLATPIYRMCFAAVDVDHPHVKVMVRRIEKLIQLRGDDAVTPW